MPFEYGCFISYRHGDCDLVKRINDDLYQALSGELEVMIGKDRIYIDTKRLEGGDFFNPALAKALCRSVCMVMIYIPMYFDMDSTYCAREYKAMLALEHKRLLLLPEEKRDHGLIIPVIMRGMQHLPGEIKNNRQCYDFSNFLLCDDKLDKHPDYAPQIQKIADYITNRCQDFASVGDPCGMCEGFSFPEEKDIMGWLLPLVDYRTPFPRREAV